MWKLADLAETTATRPSSLLGLDAAGWPNDVRLDFDFAVRDLKRWADARTNETRLVADHDRSDGKPKKAVPRYATLADVLGLDGEDDEVTMPMLSAADAEDIAAAILSGSWDDDGEDA